MMTLRLALVTLLSCSVLYPLLVLALGRAVAAGAAEGSLLRDREGKVIGSHLVAQAFSRDDYLWPRPSAVGYDAAAAGGSNLASTNPELRLRAAQALAGLQQGVGAPTSTPVPAELVTASGSGLDPHVSLAGALWQAPRIAAGFARTDLRAEVAAVGNDAAAVAVGASRSTLRPGARSTTSAAAPPASSSSRNAAAWA